MDDPEAKKEVDIPKYKSFIMLLIELGIENISFVNNVKNNSSLIDDYINGEKDEAIYKDFLDKFKGIILYLNKDECNKFNGKWNYYIIFKTFPKIK